MTMKVGITLPQFREDADAALRVARHAEAAGLDGVFVFDHLWPIGRPDRPALHSHALLGALAAETERVVLGPLVARVGLVPDAVLVNVLATLHRMLGDRLIAGLGVGDRLSQAENEAYGVPFGPAADRLASMAWCCRELRRRGITTWVGGLSDATRELAADEADAWNVWGVVAADLAERVAGVGVDVTWGGQVKPGTDDIRARLRSLERAGATWAVLAPVDAPWGDAVEAIAAARATL